MRIGGMYTIDFTRVSKIPKFNVSVKTGDSKRTISLILLENNKIINLNDYTVTVAAKKSDGNDIFNDVKIIDAENGICEVEVTKQMSALDTDLPCEIVLYGADGTVASSSNFVISKISSVRNEESIVSSSEFTSLTKALTEVKNIDNRFKEVDSQIKEIENQLMNKIHLVSNGDLTTDDINNAINTIESGIIELSGVFNSIGSGINLKSNVKLIGIREAIIQGNNWLCNTNIYETEPVMYENIVIENIEFKHLDNTFKENVGQLMLANVKNVVVNNCKFIGSKSDGISIGGGIIYGVVSHNYNITITNCIFDGVNNENRNAITLSDVDSCLIDNNIFENFTKSNMPGAIDIEIDDSPHWVVRNIKITNNYFNRIGGNVGVITFFAPIQQSKLNIQAENIIIANNTIENTKNTAGGIVLQQHYDKQGNSVNIIVENNTIKNIQNSRGFVVRGIKGVNIKGNTFLKCGLTSLVGYDSEHDMCENIKISSNYFEEQGLNDGVGITVFDVEHLTINHNIFKKIGLIDESFGYMLSFDSSKHKSSHIKIENNTFYDNNESSVKGVALWNEDYNCDINTNTYKNNSCFNMKLNYFKYSKNEFYSDHYKYNASTLPDEFPLGVSTMLFIESDNNLPEGLNFGIVETLKFTDIKEYRTTIYQRLYSDLGNTPVTYLRKATWNNNAWDSWQKI